MCTVDSSKATWYSGPHCFVVFIIKNINFVVFIVFTIVNNSYVNILILKMFVLLNVS